MPEDRRWTHRPEGSNWGDFGIDDQVGRLNLITPTERRAAIAEVKEGMCFLLSLPLDYPGGEEPNSQRRAPILFARDWGGKPAYNFPMGPKLICSDDHVVMSLQYSTQWDGLAHIGAMFDVDGSGTPVAVYYNGWRAHEHVVGPEGERPPCAHKLGVENLALTCVQGRGIFFDFALEFGTDHTLIGYDELMRTIDRQGIDVRSGDIMVSYTGYGDVLMGMAKRPDYDLLHRTGAALDGGDQRLLDWITDSGIAAIISDNPAVEYQGPDTDFNSHDLLPLHEHCIFKLGIPLGEYFWLGDLAAYLRQSGRSAFLLTAPPLRLPGAVGSPASPVATV